MSQFGLRFAQGSLASPQFFFGPHAVGDVNSCPNKLANARFVDDRAAHRVDIFQRSIRQNQPVLLYKITSFANRPNNRLLRATSILRVDSLEKRRIGRDRLLRVETKDAKMFLRPVGFSGGHIPTPAAGMAYPLSLSQ